MTWIYLFMRGAGEETGVQFETLTTE